MKKLMTVLAATAMSFGLFAETAETQYKLHDFEVDEEEVPAIGEPLNLDYEIEAGIKVWSAGETNPTMVNAYDSDHPAPTPFGEDTMGDSYLGIETDGAPLFRGFADSNGDAVDFDKTFVSTYVQFTAADSAPANIGDDAKIALWLQEDEEAGTTNLMVSCGIIDADGFATETTNVAFAADGIEPNSWHKVTIKPVYEADEMGAIGAGFLVYLDGATTPLAVKDDVTLVDSSWATLFSSTIQGFITAKQFLPSRVSLTAGDSAKQLAGIAFDGTGAIDNLDVSEEDPFPFVTYVAEIDGTGYPTIEAAIEAVQAGKTIKLLADLSATVIVPAGKNFTLDFNGRELKTDWGIKNSGTLTIVNGKINTSEGSVVLYGGSVTTIESGTFTATDNAVIMGQGLEQNKNVTLTINGGTFNGGITTDGYIACGVYVANSGTYAINGGTFNITNGCAICARAGQVTVADEATFDVTGSITGKVGDKNVAIPCVDMYIDYSEPPYPGYDETAFLKAEDNTLTIAEGFEWAGTGGLYTLQAKSTEVDPTVINLADIPAGTKVSGIFTKVPSEFADVDALKFATWCQKKGNTALVGEFGADAQLDAFLLDCLNSPVEIEKEKAKFVIVSITQDANGDWIVLVTGETGQDEKYGNGYVNIIPATEIPAVEDVSAFFKAELTIAPATQD